MVDVVTIPPRFQEHQAVARTCRRRRRLQNKLSAPRANVTETTASSPQCIRVTSTALNSSASAAKSTPAGKRTIHEHSSHGGKHRVPPKTSGCRKQSQQYSKSYDGNIRGAKPRMDRGENFRELSMLRHRERDARSV